MVKVKFNRRHTIHTPSGREIIKAGEIVEISLTAFASLQDRCEIVLTPSELKQKAEAEDKAIQKALSQKLKK